MALVREALDALNGGALDRMLSHLAPDVEADWSEAVGPYSGVYRGHEGVRSLWEGFFDAWTGLRWDLEELRDLGDGRVISVTTMTGSGKESGIEVAARAAWLWAIAGGAVERIRIFHTLDDALRAA